MLLPGYSVIHSRQDYEGRCATDGEGSESYTTSAGARVASLGGESLSVCRQTVRAAGRVDAQSAGRKIPEYTQVSARR